ncbi:MAG: hypothetical protein FH756_01875 [Firmicutes bacterium]|nr:hypothetical protein [Bacillota bacterium]
MKLRKTLLLLLVAVFILTVAGCGQESVGNQNGSNEKVAVVEGEAIYKQEFDDQMEQVKAAYKQQGQDLEAEENKEVLENTEQQVLNEMINNVVLLQHAEKAGVTAPEQEVESQMEAFKSQYNESKFSEILEANNLSEADLGKDIFNQITIDNYMQGEIEEEKLSVSEDEIRKSYDQVIEQQPEGQRPAYEDVKPQIEGMLMQEKMQAAKSELLQGLKENMEIEVLL